MGEFKVHRVRFFDYMPSGIRALAFNQDTERMAVARVDGSVEVFHCSDRFFQEKIIPGREQCGIEGLSWVGERLFSAGLNGGITEYDLTNQKVKYTIDAYGGPIWTIAGNQQGTHLANEDSLVVGTSEGIVVQFQFVSMVLEKDDKEWVRTRTFRNHTHDIRAVAEITTAVVSGGMDAQLVVRPLLDKIEERSAASALRKIHFPHRRLLSCARKSGLMLFQYPGHLELWRLGESEGKGIPGSSLFVKRNPEKLLHLKVKGEDHIRCSAVSPCGEWIVYSTASTLRLYRLHCDNNNISITKISKLPKVLSSANQLCFSSDSSHLFSASAQSSVHLVSISQSGCKFVGTLKPKSGSHQAIHLLAASENGKWVASANSDHEVHIYNLQTRKAHCTVPVYSSAVTAMGIHPATNCLFMMHADQQMFEYSIEQKQYTDWSRTVQRKGLHRLWVERDTPCLNVMFNPQNPSHVILHDMYMLCIIDQSLPLPDDKTQFYNQLTLKSLTEEQRKSHSHAFKVCKTFKDILCVELMPDQSLVVVERPLEDIATQLPAPIKQKKFAT
ncbi:U3 small nucleolar RNA-associated protein 4 homolog [Sinocyclocheilus anshuiensis]|uniref:U3 small nucleolar RNA-associated protein 4 homolog n=1 Tax=Sinocyclocheilus anshuiensis TaxID=1608454 RepID=UPI0007BA168A|nr:PREDICTED: U3 small nucleolar RNA-associated protein 4 homolog [Sinocyclocheilus anshuiensis]